MQSRFYQYEPLQLLRHFFAVFVIFCNPFIAMQMLHKVVKRWYISWRWHMLDIYYGSIIIKIFTLKLLVHQFSRKSLTIEIIRCIRKCSSNGLKLYFRKELFKFISVDLAQLDETLERHQLFLQTLGMRQVLRNSRVNDSRYANQTYCCSDPEILKGVKGHKLDKSLRTNWRPQS